MGTTDVATVPSRSPRTPVGTGRTPANPPAGKSFTGLAIEHVLPEAADGQIIACSGVINAGSGNDTIAADDPQFMGTRTLPAATTP
jgi:hypothetical protein